MVDKDTFPKITERELDRLRRVMNVELEARDPFNRYASPDTIRHFAHAIGDDNPLFTDERYAESTRWGGPVAPPTFLFSCFGRGAPQGLRGIHSMWGGASFDMNAPITSGTRIAGTVALTGLTPKESRFAAKTILQEHVYTFKDSDGELLARVKEWHLRTERDTARRRAKHRKLEPASYTPEEIEGIFQDYDKEVVRGEKPRFWEDTKVGEELPPVVKGPLRVTDNVAWKVGWGFRPFTYAHKLGMEYYRRHPMAFIPNEQGVPDVPERVHWDEDFARRVGVPTSYDFGPQRVAWLGQVVTNWMGDDGFMVGFWGEVRRFNLVGDTHWLRGEVTGKVEREGRKLMKIALSGVDQREKRLFVVVRKWSFHRVKGDRAHTAMTSDGVCSKSGSLENSEGATIAPLTGIKVLDLCEPEGQLCGRLLADLGAEVILVEPPGGDPGRGLGPFAENVPSPEASLSFAYLNANKKSIVLDLTTPGGREKFRSMAREFDVVLETFPPG